LSGCGTEARMPGLLAMGYRLAALNSVVTNIKPRGDWKEGGAGGTTLIRRQTPLIVILFGFNFLYDLSRK